MKYIFKFLTVAIILLATTACEKPDYTISDSIKHVAFDGSSAIISEGVEVKEVIDGVEVEYDVADTLRIPIYLTTRDKNLSVKVEFTIEGSAEEGIHYTITNRDNFTVNGSDIFNYLEIVTIDNDVVGGDKSFTITISNLDNEEVNIGIGGVEKNTFMVDIIDDEHPLAFLFGSYDVSAVSYFNGPTGWSSAIIESVKGSNTEVDIRGLLFEPQYENKIRGVVDLENNTITIAAGQVLYTHPTYGDAYLGPISLDGSSLTWYPEDDLILTINPDGTVTWSNYGIHVEAGFFDALETATWTKN